MTSNTRTGDSDLGDATSHASHSKDFHYPLLSCCCPMSDCKYKEEEQLLITITFNNFEKAVWDSAAPVSCSDAPTVEFSAIIQSLSVDALISRYIPFLSATATFC